MYTVYNVHVGYDEHHTHRPLAIACMKKSTTFAFLGQLNHPQQKYTPIAMARLRNIEFVFAVSCWFSQVSDAQISMPQIQSDSSTIAFAVKQVTLKKFLRQNVHP